MQAAKDAVKKFTSKDGHHDTTVHEQVSPAVTSETVRPEQEERVTQAVDREVHQDHYHTSVQPVHDKEVLPEQHHHQAAGVEHRHVNHDDHARNKEHLAQEAAQFKDTSVRHDTHHTTTVNPTVTGTHTHHHVHENIQPVVHKQTVEPHVMHTTVPVHEVHQNAAQHHSTSTLPAVGMQDFKKAGGALTGREERHDAFEGAPRHHHHHGEGTNTTAAGTTHGQGTFDNFNNNGTTHGQDTLDNNLNNNGGVHNTNTRGLDSTTSGQTTGKPSLMDKLNPKVDADGDGKRGLMD
ncbi:Hypothetical predicted protein [Lecanosticta acicola]|uniref:Allergen n=1 Tax=Lecanosticta acicola TaxID=111012 RepID=A0AAI8YU84_9PEZI|nr:Hypothetical predicted protein [Lecanosticta acicola]